MGERYSHLNITERNLLKNWNDQGVSIREIGRRLNRHHSTISRELRRNLWCGKYYYFAQAQRFYDGRLKRRAQRFRLKSEKMRDHVLEKLKIGWTPELISGRMKATDDGRYICHESIYQFIYLESPEWIDYLARKHRKRRTKYPYRKQAQRIKDRVSITQRPPAVDSREGVGHWESDTLVGGDRKSGLNVVLERASRLVNISMLTNKSARQTKKALIRRLGNHPCELVKSITYDNGSENVLHSEINDRLETESYFCEPYHSWEKGSVEQVNGLIRRYFPKGTDFNQLDYSEIIRVEKLLNNRPRKCLNYRTPYEVFREACGALTR
jgi:transposase, IS30 family